MNALNKTYAWRRNFDLEERPVDRNDPEAAATAVAAIRAAILHKLFPVERYATVAAVTGLHGDLNSVNKRRHTFLLLLTILFILLQQWFFGLWHQASAVPALAAVRFLGAGLAAVSFFALGDGTGVPVFLAAS